MPAGKKSFRFVVEPFLEIVCLVQAAARTAAKIKVGVPVGEETFTVETFVRSYTDQKIRQLKEEYAAIAELRNPAMEIQLVRAVMTHKVNHVLQRAAHTRKDGTRRPHPATRRPTGEGADEHALPGRRHGVEQGITTHP